MICPLWILFFLMYMQLPYKMVIIQPLVKPNRMLNPFILLLKPMSMIVRAPLILCGRSVGRPLIRWGRASPRAQVVLVDRSVKTPAHRPPMVKYYTILPLEMQYLYQLLMLEKIFYLILITLIQPKNGYPIIY